MNNLPIILSILPLLAFVYLLFIRKTTLFKSSILTLGFYVFLAIFYWKIEGHYLYASFGKGVFVAFDIFLIIFGAILFLEVLKKIKIIDNISYYLSIISKDYRIQVIFIAWFFECLLEGTAGFGIPAAIAVPLLIGLGLSPIKSLIVGLLGNSTPGIFGAAGTPIKVGLSTLNTPLVPYYASLFNMVGMIVPIFMMWTITRGRKNQNKEFKEAIPFALWSGFLFVFFSFITVSLGREFPTILGSILGLIFAIISVKIGLFMPKNILSLKEEEVKKERTMSPIKAFLPYILLIISLILGKIILGNIKFPIGINFSHNFNLYNPGLIFVFVALIVVLIWKVKGKTFFNSMKEGAKGAVLPFIIIASMIVMVEIMKNSGNNLSGIPSAINIIAKAIESSFLPFFAPFAGSFGALLTGSVTAASIMFGTIFDTSALSMGFNNQIILGLLVVGGGIGNMIALADILTAEVVVGVKNKEREIVYGVLIPCLICLFLVGILGLILINII